MSFFRNRPFALFCCYFIGAITAAELLPYGLAPIFFIAPACAGVFLLLLRLIPFNTKLKSFKKLLLRSAVCFLCVGAGLFCHWALCTRALASFPLDESPHEIEAVLTEKLYTTFDGASYSARLRTVDGKRARGKLLLTLDTETEYEGGDKVNAIAVFSLPEEVENGFSQRKYIRSRGMLVCVEEEKSSGDILLCKDNSLPALCARLRSGITKRIVLGAGDDRGICAALLTGDRSGVDDMLTLDLTRAGTLHLLAISGMHFTVLMGAIGALLRLTRLKKHLRLIIMACAALFYCAVAGFSYSVMRAAIMLLLLYCSYFAGRERDLYTALFAATAIILGAEPSAAANTGLWLSVFATFGVIFAAELFSDSVFKLKRKSKLIHGVVSVIIMPLAVSVFAMVCTLPVAWLSFGQISLISPVATLVCGMAINLLLFLSVIFAMTGAPLPALTPLAERLCELLTELTERFSDAAPVYSLKYPFAPYIVCAVAVFAAVAVLSGNKTRKAALCLTLAAVIAFPVAAASYERSNEDIFSTVTYSYGRNDILLFSQNGNTVAVDMTDGYTSAANGTVASLHTLYETDIDTIVITRLNKAAIRMVENLGTSVRIRKVAYPSPVTDEEKKIAAELLYAAHCVRAATEKYSFGKSFEAEGTALCVYSEAAEHSAVPIRVVSAERNERNVLFVSSGISSSAQIADFRSMARGADLLIIGASGPKNIHPLHFTAKCTTVFASPELSENASEPYGKLLPEIDVRYCTEPLRIDMP